MKAAIAELETTLRSQARMTRSLGAYPRFGAMAFIAVAT